MAGLANHSKQGERWGRKREVRGGEASPVNSSRSEAARCKSPNRSRKGSEAPTEGSGKWIMRDAEREGVKEDDSGRKRRTEAGRGSLGKNHRGHLHHCSLLSH